MNRMKSATKFTATVFAALRTNNAVAAPADLKKLFPLIACFRKRRFTNVDVRVLINEFQNHADACQETLKTSNQVL